MSSCSGPRRFVLCQRDRHGAANAADILRPRFEIRIRLFAGIRGFSRAKRSKRDAPRLLADQLADRSPTVLGDKLPQLSRPRRASMTPTKNRAGRFFKAYRQSEAAQSSMHNSIATLHRNWVVAPLPHAFRAEARIPRRSHLRAR
jgi:hypothetical protein